MCKTLFCTSSILVYWRINHAINETRLLDRLELELARRYSKCSGLR